MNQLVRSFVGAATLTLVAACGGNSAEDKPPESTLSSEDEAGVAAMREANPNLDEHTDKEVIESAESTCEELDSLGVEGLLDVMMTVGKSEAAELIPELVQAIKWKCPEHEDALREWALSRG